MFWLQWRLVGAACDLPDDGVRAMRKTRLLNSEISHLVSLSGHTDEITVADAGLPVPADVKRVDLALVRGTPSFIETLEPLLEEMAVESVVLAEEIRSHNPQVYQQLLALLEKTGAEQGQAITISYVSHEQFKQQSHGSRAVIRTGEATPYANVILQSGVAF